MQLCGVGRHDITGGGWGGVRGAMGKEGKKEIAANTGTPQHMLRFFLDGQFIELTSH